MGIYIKDIKMPTTCEECRYFRKTRNLIDLDYKYHCINGASALVFPSVYEYRAFDCPLIDVPEPHGRLINASGLKDELTKAIPNYIIDAKSRWFAERLGRANIEVDAMPTIIEGSK